MKKKILGIGATVLILSAAVFAGCGLTGTRIRFGAAGLGGTYHAFADTFAGLITAGKEKCTVEVKTTAGRRICGFYQTDIFRWRLRRMI